MPISPHGFEPDEDARVLLICPPWFRPDTPSLGLAVVAGALARAGVRADTLHANVLFPRTRARTPAPTRALYFAPHMYADVSADDCADAVVETFLCACNVEGARFPSGVGLDRFGIDEACLRADVVDDVGRAGVAIDRAVEQAARGGYDVVGVGCTFETQILAGVLFCRRLKQLRPGIRVVFGGPACAGELAEGLLQAFDVIDAVCYGEGDDVVVPLVECLLRGHPAAGVAGVVWRDGDFLRRNAPVPLVSDLDRVPLPAYDSFFAQQAASEWADLPPRIWFEMSRGCWWGQKHLCRFCGLLAEKLAFRKKTPDRALAEIRHLAERYPAVERLYAADNILDMTYFESVLPRLAELRLERSRPLRLFCEVKSNLRRAELMSLAAAGCDHIFPGVESFSDEVLELMCKGSTGIGNAQSLKWMHEHGMAVSYNVIVRNPGESARHYEDMSDMVPYLEHLPPPSVVAMNLERHSPYFTSPEEHEITAIRPRPYYDLLYRGPHVDTGALAYTFRYAHATLDDEDLVAARRRFVARVDAWREGWRVDLAYHEDLGEDGLLVIDRRGQAHRSYRVPGLAAGVYRTLDASKPLPALSRRHPGLDADVMGALLDLWRHRRWVYRNPRDRCLAVLPRKLVPERSCAAAEEPPRARWLGELELMQRRLL